MGATLWKTVIAINVTCRYTGNPDIVMTFRPWSGLH